MADTKISALTAVATPAGTDEHPVNQAGTTKKITTAQLQTADVHATFSEYTGQAADPSAPTAAMRWYTRSIAGRYLPRFIGPSAEDSSCQPSMFANNVVMWLVNTAGTTSIAFNSIWTITITQATPAITNTNFMTQMKRATFTTTTTANNQAGVRSGAPVCWRGNAAGQGGFFFAARFGILTYQSAMRILVGLSGLATVLAADPSATNDTCGMTKDTAETVWQVMTRDTSAASKTSTGRTTAAAGTGEVFDLYMFCAPNDSQITFRVIDLTTNTVLVDNVSKSSNLPTSNVMLTAHAECQNVTGGAGTACAIFLNKIYIETDN